MTRALIAIGTNSTRLLVLDGLRRLAAESRGTRIGQGLGADGTLAPDARERTLAAVGDYVAIVRSTSSRPARFAGRVMRQRSVPRLLN